MDTSLINSKLLNLIFSCLPDLDTDFKLILHADFMNLFLLFFFFAVFKISSRLKNQTFSHVSNIHLHTGRRAENQENESENMFRIN